MEIFITLIILVIAFTLFVVGVFLKRLKKRLVNLINKTADRFFDYSVDILIKVFFYYVLFRIANLKGKQKLIVLLIKLHKRKLVRYKKKEVFFMRFTIILLEILDKFKGSPVQVVEPLLLYPANHSKIYR